MVGGEGRRVGGREGGKEGEKNRWGADRQGYNQVDRQALIYIER